MGKTQLSHVCTDIILQSESQTGSLNMVGKLQVLKVNSADTINKTGAKTLDWER